MKNIVITGGTSGVGFAIAKEIAKEGHNIIIVGRHEYKAHIAQKKLGNNVKVAIGDLSDEAEREGVIDEIKRSFSHIDVLIHGAGVLPRNASENIYVNLLPHYYLTTRLRGLLANSRVLIITGHPQAGKKIINAKTVLIASGGFAQNRAMMSVYAPDLLRLGTTNHPGATGDGIKLATTAGGALVDMNKVQVHPTAQQETDHIYLIGERLRGAGAILINHLGKRFTNEMATRDQVTKAINDLHQDGATLVFDQGICEAFKAADFYVAMGLAVSGNTIYELAEKIGVNPNNLEKTVSSWNMYQKAFEDIAFDRQTGMDRGIEKSPYYAIHIKPAVHYTIGGIKTNRLTEVLNEIGEAVPGLFAAGEVVGGLHGDNRIGGNSIAETIVFGRQAGQQAAKHVLSLS
ncbi:flavocytochrome c [Leuconostoc mesenteroides]|uniref:flavocytochrome c n=1 Tax=Leuconostoc mesenteroides TaxID=1245 RepID=UPI0019522614|nr:flavocytochrome c [Leuconostoc mesenteroides]